MGTLVLLRTIGDSFNITSPPQLAWLVAGYSLTLGTFILISGRLGDVLGHKRMLLTGFSWFSIWSAIAGMSVYSKSYKFAVFTRVLQGIGPAICMPNALAILGTFYPPGPRKAMVFAIFGAVAPIGAVLGGVFASLLALAWWPWSLWALAIWLAILAVAGHFVLPTPPKKTKQIQIGDWKSISETLDLPGAFVGIVSLVLFNFAWTQAPIDGWPAPSVIVSLILGVLLFGAFLLVEFKLSPMPLLPFDIVNADVGFVLATTICGWATFGIWTLYLVQILQDIRQLSPLLTITWFCPVAIVGACAAVVTGKLFALQVRPSIIMTLALLAFLAGSTLTALAPTDQVYWGQIFVSMLIMPFGMDMSFPAATLILSDAVSKEHQGLSASLVNTVVNYGITLGVGFAGTVEMHTHGKGGTMEDRLRGFLAALYMGVGLAELGFIVCLVFLVTEFLRSPTRKG